MEVAVDTYVDRCGTSFWPVSESDLAASLLHDLIAAREQSFLLEDPKRPKSKHEVPPPLPLKKRRRRRTVKEAAPPGVVPLPCEVPVCQLPKEIADALERGAITSQTRFKFGPSYFSPLALAEQVHREMLRGDIHKYDVLNFRLMQIPDDQLIPA